MRNQLGLYLVICLLFVVESANTQILRPNNVTDREFKEFERQTNWRTFGVPGTVADRKLSSERMENKQQLDSDRDGINDNEEILIKTDPQNPDTDGDGLLDGWEVSITNDVNLRKLGASPLHKDIFVEMDYMTRNTARNGLGPNQKVILGIQEAFSSAPVSNPDGTTGINIHLIPGNEIPYDETLYPLFTEFAAIKKQHFDSTRAPFFHYMIWANSYDYGRSSGYSLDIPGSDFIVTLGTWNNNNGGEDNEKIGTFIHELGHNLGLRHGGIEDINYKPNHLSVMNYRFQVTGIIFEKGGVRDRYFTYQPFGLPELDETSLIDLDGLGKGSELTGYFTQFVCDGVLQTKPAQFSIDWNCNNTDDSRAPLDLNGDGYLGPLLPTPNEWLQLYFRGGLIGRIQSLQGLIDISISEFRRHSFIELTEEMARVVKNSN